MEGLLYIASNENLKNKNIHFPHFISQITKLKELKGIDSVKNDISSFLVNLIDNRILNCNPLSNFSLNLHINGESGSGKTFISNLISQIYLSLCLNFNNENEFFEKITNEMKETIQKIRNEIGEEFLSMESLYLERLNQLTSQIVKKNNSLYNNLILKLNYTDLKSPTNCKERIRNIIQLSKNKILIIDEDVIYDGVYDNLSQIIDYFITNPSHGIFILNTKCENVNSYIPNFNQCFQTKFKLNYSLDSLFEIFINKMNKYGYFFQNEELIIDIKTFFEENNNKFKNNCIDINHFISICKYYYLKNNSQYDDIKIIDNDIIKKCYKYYNSL